MKADELFKFMPKVRPPIDTIYEDYPFHDSAFSKGNKYVYAMVAGDVGPVKIGIARHPFVRLKDLQTGCPAKIRLVELSRAISEGVARDVETRLHYQLSGYRVSGEWFEYHAAYPYIYGCCWRNLSLIDFAFDIEKVIERLK